MPELPDVEVYRRYFDSTALHEEVSRVQPLDEKVLGGITAKSLAARMTGRASSSSHRHGKYLLARFHDEGFLALHFGMSGFLKYYRNEDEKPEHPRLILHFSNGYKLAYDLTQRLGRIEWADSVEQLIERHRLGPDPLDESLSPKQLAERLRGRRGMIKTALMDQGLIAGIGNIYSDEILFQAGIHPRSKVGALDKDRLEALCSDVRSVLEKAVEKGADPRRMPSNWLLPARGQSEECPRCGGRLRKEKVGGRSTWFCTSHQSG